MRLCAVEFLTAKERERGANRRRSRRWTDKILPSPRSNLRTGNSAMPFGCSRFRAPFARFRGSWFCSDTGVGSCQRTEAPFEEVRRRTARKRSDGLGSPCHRFSGVCRDLRHFFPFGITQGAEMDGSVAGEPNWSKLEGFGHRFCSPPCDFRFHGDSATSDRRGHRGSDGGDRWRAGWRGWPFPDLLLALHGWHLALAPATPPGAFNLTSPRAWG